MRKRMEFKVSLIPPDGAKGRDVREYIEDAIASMKGCLKPPGVDEKDPDGNPMFNLDGDSVKVTRIRK